MCAKKRKRNGTSLSKLIQDLNQKLDATLEENNKLKAELKDKVNRTAKDSVFTDLFSKPEYAYELFRCLYPDRTDVQQTDIQLVTIQNVLGTFPYNDVGFLVGNELIVLAEAQSTWTINIVFRVLEYAIRTLREYLNSHNYDLGSAGAVHCPIVHSFVVYTGNRKSVPSELSFRHVFYNDAPKQIDCWTTVIRLDDTEGVLKEYIAFCKIFDEQMLLYPSERAKAVKETIRLCKERHILLEYLSGREVEVEKIMMAYTYYQDENRISGKQIASIAAYKMIGFSDEDAVRAVAKMYNVKESYIWGLLEYWKEHPNEPRLW